MRFAFSFPDEINPAQVEWDSAPAIDPVQVKWDNEPQGRSMSEELGRQVGLTGRAALGGIGSLVSMVGDPLNVTINKVAGTSLQPVSTSIQRGLDLIFPKPENGTERIAQDVAGAMAGGAGTIGVANKVAQVSASPLTRTVAKLFGQGPAMQIVSSGAAGAGAGAAREMGLGPVGQFVGALAGGITPAAATATVQTAQRMARPLTAAVSPRTAERIAAERIAGMVARPAPGSAMTPEEAMALRIGRALPDSEIVPGSMPTTAQLLDDTQMLMAERARRSNNPEFGAQFADRASQQHAARAAHLNQVSRVTKDLSEAGQDAGAVIRQAYDDELATTRNMVRQAYEPLHADTSPTQSLQAAKGQASTVLSKYFGEGSGGPDAELAALADDLASMPDSVPFNTLQNLKSRAGEMEAKAMRELDTRKSAAAGQIREALDKVPETASTFRPEQAAQYRAATDLRRDMANRLETGAARDMRRQGGDHAPKLQGGEIPRAFFNDRGTSKQDAEQFMKALGGRKEAVDSLRNYAVTSLNKFAAHPTTQQFTPSKFGGWLRSHEPALSTLFEKQHLEKLQAISKDLERAGMSDAAGRMPTSETAMNLAHAGTLDRLLSKIPGGTLIAGIVGKVSDEQIGQIVNKAMLDPQFASMLLSKVGPENSGALARRLAQGLAASGVGNSVATSNKLAVDEEAAPSAPKMNTEKTALIEQARSAIARGAPKDKVIERLKGMGVDPTGL